MTVAEHVALAGQVAAKRRALGRAAAGADALERVRLTEKSAALAADLSHGDKRKLEIAMLLASGAERLLLLDEPMAGVASGDVPELVDVIRSLHRDEGRTVLMVEHHMEVLLGLADRVAVMHHGALLAIDTPERIMADAAGAGGLRGGRAVILELDDVRVTLGGSHILQGVSFTVAPTGVTALLGRNGVGKTTTVKAILGLVPRTGRIAFAGGPVHRLRTHEIVRARHRLRARGPLRLRQADRRREPGPGRAARHEPRLRPGLRTLPRAQDRAARRRPARCPAASSRWSRSRAPSSTTTA